MQMSRVDCSRGAPMGRHPIGDTPTRPVRLFQVVLEDGYDDGGAYWGVGNPLYCVQGEGFERTTRAKNIREARDWFQFQYGSLEYEPLDIERDWLPVFFWAYLETAMEDNDEDDERFCDTYTSDDVDAESQSEMRADCLKFLEEARPILELVERLEGVGMWSVPAGAECSMIEYAGHDFWLTRRRSGTGFWDGDWPEDFDGRNLGEELTEIAHKFNECCGLYVHEDKIYFNG